MIDDIDLMRLHVNALFTRDATGRLLSVNEPGGAAAPRFFLGRTARGNVWCVRHDVGETLARELGELCKSQRPLLDIEADRGDAAPAPAPAPFIACLSRRGPVSKTWAGPTFSFPADLPDGESTVRVTLDNATLLSPYLEDWREDVAAGVPMAAVLEDGKAVSLCCSVRVTPQAHEAGVETHPDFRRRGHATRAVAAWARAVRDMGRMPLYSTSWENQSSRALARKLGLVQFGVDLHIT